VEGGGGADGGRESAGARRSGSNGWGSAGGGAAESGGCSAPLGRSSAGGRASSSPSTIGWSCGRPIVLCREAVQSCGWRGESEKCRERAEEQQSPGAGRPNRRARRPCPGTTSIHASRPHCAAVLWEQPSRRPPTKTSCFDDSCPFFFLPPPAAHGAAADAAGGGGHQRRLHHVRGRRPRVGDRPPDQGAIAAPLVFAAAAAARSLASLPLHQPRTDAQD